MQTDFFILVQRADVDMICDICNAEITIGEDFYYDEETEEVCCEHCAEKHSELDLRFAS
jgi:hypothetical protein